jgi:hypothetical protein
MYHKILGQLHPVKNKNGEVNRYEGLFEYESGTIKFIISDIQDIHRTIQLAQNILLNITKFDAKAKEIVSKDLLKTYNDVWRESEDTPILADTDFKKRITLQSILFLGEDGIDFLYNDDDLFLGHSIVIFISDGLQFEDSQVTLYD